jgi:hypothetical protein
MPSMLITSLLTCNRTGTAVHRQVVQPKHNGLACSCEVYAGMHVSVLPRCPVLPTSTGHRLLCARHLHRQPCLTQAYTAGTAYLRGGCCCERNDGCIRKLLLQHTQLLVVCAGSQNRERHKVRLYIRQPPSLSHPKTQTTTNHLQAVWPR